MTEQKSGERALARGEANLRADLNQEFGDLADLVGAPGEDEPGSGEAEMSRTFITWAIPEGDPLALLPSLGLKGAAAMSMHDTHLFECYDGNGNRWNLALTPQFRHGEGKVVFGLPAFEAYPDEVYREWESPFADNYSPRDLTEDHAPSEPKLPFLQAAGEAMLATKRVHNWQAGPWADAAADLWLRTLLGYGDYPVRQVWDLADSLGLHVEQLARVRRAMGVTIYGHGEGRERLSYWHLEPV